MKTTRATVREEVRSFLTELEKLSSEHELLASYRREIKETVERIGRHETVLMVLGEVTKGKSELVNALIGDRLLPTNPRPTTVIPHYLRWGPTLNIRLVDGTNGKTVRHLSQEELLTLSDEEQGQSCKQIRVDIEHPAEFLKGGLVVVDTPGVNDINMQKEELLYRDLPAADAAIMVFDSRYVLTRTEATFLGDSLPETCKNRLLLVLSKIDRLDEDERAEVADWTREGLDKIGLQAPFFPVSATEALDEGNEEDGGVPALKSAVGELLAQGGAGFVIDNLLVRTAMSLGQAQSDLRFKVEALAAGGKEAAARRAKLGEELGVRRGEANEVIEGFSAELTDARDTLVSDMKLFALDFRKAVPEALDGVAAEDIKKYLPFFIRDTFKEWLTAALPETEKRIQAAAERAAAVLTHGVRELRQAAGLGNDPADTGADGSADTLGVKLALSTGISGYDIGVAVLSVMGGITLFINVLAGGLLTAAAAAAAVQFKRERDAEVLAEAKIQAPQAVEDSWKRLEETLLAHFNEYEKRVTAKLRAIFEEEVARLRSALDEAVDLASSSGVEIEAVRQQCTDLLTCLEGRQQRLNELRSLVAELNRPAGSAESKE